EKAVRTAHGRILSPGDDHFRRHPLRIVVALRQKLRAVRDEEIADHRFHRDEARCVAGVTREPELHPIRAAEAVGEKRDRPADIAAGALYEHHGFGAEFLADLLQTALAQIVRFSPAYRLEA